MRLEFESEVIYWRGPAPFFTPRFPRLMPRKFAGWPGGSAMAGV